MTKILLIEDDILSVELYSKKFRSQGFEVAAAYDGNEGIELMRQFVPDLVLLDIMMPRVNGAKVLEMAKASEDLKDIPIVMLSNIDTPESMRTFLENGAYDFIIKSEHSADEVVRKINDVLKRIGKVE